MTFKLPKPSGKYGYTEKQVENICKKLKIDLDKFWLAFGVNTVAVVGDKYNYFPCDIETTLFKLTNGKVGKNHGWD